MSLLVIHAESDPERVLSVARTPGEIAEMLKSLAGVHSHERELPLPIVPNSQDMPSLERAIDVALAAFPEAPAYLVAGHGLTTWASDLRALQRQLEGLEFLLECALAEERLPPSAG